MRSPNPHRRSKRASATLIMGTAAVLAVGVLLTPSQASSSSRHPSLVGRAVLPALTLAGSPPAGAFFAPSVSNGVAFPLAGQPVEGFSAIVDGREPGEFLAMPDNGFGSKVTSPDFLIRAYYVRPRFKTARGGDGTVTVGDFISFRDPGNRIGFPLVNEGTSSRLLTGGDIDPESLQRGRNGDLWVGDEFGPWILHFSSTGVLLDPPFACRTGSGRWTTRS